MQSTGMRVTIASDVTNPLLGSSGATRIFGPFAILLFYDLKLSGQELMHINLRINSRIK
jgi:glycerate kinase